MYPLWKIVEVSQKKKKKKTKTRIRTNIGHSNFIPGYIYIYPKKKLIWKDIHTPVFTAALITIAKVCKWIKCPSTH